jgi:hypothetical protein
MIISLVRYSSSKERAYMAKKYCGTAFDSMYRLIDMDGAAVPWW